MTDPDFEFKMTIVMGFDEKRISKLGEFDYLG
jgi:hypothetical protein